jgi:hypothetical protein
MKLILISIIYKNNKSKLKFPFLLLKFQMIIIIHLKQFLEGMDKLLRLIKVKLQLALLIIKIVEMLPLLMTLKKLKTSNQVKIKMRMMINLMLTVF